MSAPRTQEEWFDLVRWIRERDRGRLATHERKFIGDVVYPIAGYGAPSPKQAAWLRSIYFKLRGHR